MVAHLGSSPASETWAIDALRVSCEDIMAPTLPGAMPVGWGHAQPWSNISLIRKDLLKILESVGKDVSIH